MAWLLARLTSPASYAILDTNAYASYTWSENGASPQRPFVGINLV